MMTRWQLISGEYPPDTGGVSDYTALVARGLAQAGDEVCVWAPPAVGGELSHEGVRVNRLPDRFGPRGLAALARDMRRDPGARILVEYAPHAFGMRAMNLPLCLMLLGLRRNDLAVMFHEVAYPISREQSVRHNALGAVHRAMAATICRSASTIFVAAQAWAESVRRLAPASREIRWLPVPSNIAIAGDRAATMDVRTRYAAQGTTLFGHFGSYGNLVAARLEPVLDSIFSSRNEARVLLIGRNSEKFRDDFVSARRALEHRVYATGTLSNREVSTHISACDGSLPVQEYGGRRRRTPECRKRAPAHG